MTRIRDAAVLAALTVCMVLSSRLTPLQAASHQGADDSVFLHPAAQAMGNSATDQSGSKSYAANCAICHGDHREGILPGFPPLVGVGHHLKDDQIVEIIRKGKDRMPGFPNLQGEELTSLLHYLGTDEKSTATATQAGAKGPKLSEQGQAGSALFQQNCAFCHGRDTMGGESGPDLTRSKIVRADVKGDKISEVVRDGRPEKKMPAFNFSAPELQNLAAFIHEQAAMAASSKGGRRGVDIADLQTGNVQAGKQYFDSQCARCHSATGDLAGIATRFEGLELEERMLYPRNVKSKVTITLPTGKQVSGTLAYLDEFTVALRDTDGVYRSWQTNRVRFKVDAPVEAHVEQFSKYTDADIHNLMAYIQTLR